MSLSQVSVHTCPVVCVRLIHIEGMNSIEALRGWLSVFRSVNVAISPERVDSILEEEVLAGSLSKSKHSCEAIPSWCSQLTVYPIDGVGCESQTSHLVVRG